MVDFFEYCAMSKSKHKLLHKVAEEHDLNPGEIIYLDIISQKKPSYVGSKNWILIQDSDTKQKLSFFKNSKEDLIEKSAPFLDILKNMMPMSKLSAVTTQVKRRFSKKIEQNILKKLTLNLRHQALHRKMAW